MDAETGTHTRLASSGIIDSLSTLVGLPLAIVVSLLPARWRRPWRGLPLAVGTLISSVLQIALILWWGAVEYGEYARAAAGNYSVPFGAAYFVGFVLATPYGLLAIYGLLEGLVRFASAVVVGEPLATLPLWIIGSVLAALGALLSGRDPSLCRDIAVIRPDGHMLDIRTCRRRDWDSCTTIEYRGVFFRLVEERELADASRPHFYRFERVHQGDLIRRIEPYSPDELLED
ncbi:MAG: hypothetical protein MJE77_29120 [Proteobacteria bacterium]|nr:hypothetical protein [Pseudomonadota bacterium]